MLQIELPVVLGVALVVFLATLIAGVFLPVLLVLLVPGRKGKMKTRASARLSGLSTEEAARLVAERLHREGFEIVESGRPDRIDAHRPHRPPGRGPDGLEESITYSMMALRAEIEIRQQVSGVELRGRMWIGRFMDYPFLDSGEGRYIRRILQSVLAPSESGVLEPVVQPRTSYGLSTAFVIVALGLAGGVFLQLDPSASPSRRWGLLLGFQASDSLAVAMTLKCLREIRENPREHSGAGLARAARVVAVLGGAAGLGHAALHLFAR